MADNMAILAIVAPTHAPPDNQPLGWTGILMIIFCALFILTICAMVLYAIVDAGKPRTPSVGVTPKEDQK